MQEKYRYDLCGTYEQVCVLRFINWFSDSLTKNM